MPRGYYRAESVESRRVRGCHAWSSPRIWKESDASIRGSLIAFCAFLIGANVLVWLWAFLAFARQRRPARFRVPRPDVRPAGRGRRRPYRRHRQIDARAHAAGAAAGWRRLLFHPRPFAGRSPSVDSGRFDSLKTFGDISGTVASALFLLFAGGLQHNRADLGLAEPFRL